MSKLIDRIKKMILKPFTGKTGEADAKEKPPIPVPKPIKPKEEEK